MRREPEELQQDKRQAEAEANAARRREQEARNEAKTRMKGKNRPSKRYRKKRTNIVDDKKVGHGVTWQGLYRSLLHDAMARAMKTTYSGSLHVPALKMAGRPVNVDSRRRSS